MKESRSTEQTVVIQARLAGMNEIIAADRNHWAKGAALKRSLTDLCRLHFLHAIGKGFEPITDKVDLFVTWFEPNRRRDPDNIYSGMKFILDGMIKAGAIKGDTQDYIGDINNHIEVDKKNSRIEITFRRC